MLKQKFFITHMLKQKFFITYVGDISLVGHTLVAVCSLDDE